MKAPANLTIRLIDWSITAILTLVLLSWASGGIDFQAGPVNVVLFIEHSYGALLQLLFAMVLIRWLVQFQWGKSPFAVFPGWPSYFKRLLEFAIAVRIVMTLLELFHGEIQLPLARTIALHESVSLIYVMTMLRLLLSRSFGAVTLMISVPVTVIAMLYVTEAAVSLLHTQALKAHYKTIYTEEAASADYPITVPDDYDPSINEGSNWTWGHQVNNNSLGFREKEFHVPKPPGTFRIMVLGDSLTWGAGLSVRERYTSRLAHLIEQSGIEQEVEILNFGMPGGPTVTELKHLEEYHRNVDPDLIIVGFCINDPQPRGQNASVERARMHRLYTAIAELRHIGLEKTYSLIISGIDNLLISLQMIPDWPDALNRVYQDDSLDWQNFEKALAGIREISDQHGLPQPIFVNLTQGIAGENSLHHYLEEWFAKSAKAAGDNGFRVVEPMQRFIDGMEMSELAVNPLDGHPSAKANLIYAEELLEPVLSAIEQRRNSENRISDTQ